MIRRLKYLAVIFLIALCISACGHDSETETDTSADIEQTDDQDSIMNQEESEDDADSVLQAETQEAPDVPEQNGTTED